MNDPVRVKVVDRAHDGLDEFRGVLLLEVLQRADAIEQLSSLAQISDEVN